MQGKHYYAYAALVVLNVALGAFNQQLGAGQVPVPVGLAWLIPVVSAVIIVLTMLLPKLDDVPKS